MAWPFTCTWVVLCWGWVWFGMSDGAGSVMWLWWWWWFELLTGVESIVIFRYLYMLGRSKYRGLRGVEVAGIYLYSACVVEMSKRKEQKLGSNPRPDDTWLAGHNSNEIICQDDIVLVAC